MYVEKTTAEERGIIGSKVEGLIIQFDTCQTLLQDIVENGFKFKSGEATECKIDPELLCDRLWIISNLMFDTILQYNLMMGEDDDGAVQVHLDGADTAREVIAAEREKKQMLNRKLEAKGQAKAFASLLARSVREFFQDEQHRKEFEEWYLKKYGKSYVWEPVRWKR